MHSEHNRFQKRQVIYLALVLKISILEQILYVVQYNA